MGKVVKAVARLAATGAVKSKTASKVAAKPGKTESTVVTLGRETLALGKRIWAEWQKNRTYEALGIRQKTALGLKDGKAQGGTRSAMLAVAAYGYANHAEAKTLTYAVRAAQGNTPVVGGVDFPWLEKAVNIESITSTASVRPDAKDGKQRLMVKTGTGKAKVTAKRVAAKVEPRKVKDTDRSNGPVKVSVDKALRSEAQRKARAEQRAANRAKQAAQGKAQADIATLQAEQAATE
jgi:hypothetical protein